MLTAVATSGRVSDTQRRDPIRDRYEYLSVSRGGDEASAPVARVPVGVAGLGAGDDRVTPNLVVHFQFHLIKPDGPEVRNFRYWQK